MAGYTPFDASTYQQWANTSLGGAGDYTGATPWDWAYDAYKSGDKSLFQKQLDPYIGQDVEMRTAHREAAGDGMGDPGGSSMMFKDPITGMWFSVPTPTAPTIEQEGGAISDPNWQMPTEFQIGIGNGLDLEQGWQRNRASINPHLTIAQREDGTYYVKGGDYDTHSSSSVIDGIKGVAAVLGGAAIGGAFAGAAGGAAGSAGSTGAGLGSATAADIGMMYAGADAAAAGSLGMGGLTGAQVMAGAGGLGGLGTAAGSGWAEALGAEQAMGSMVLDAAPIGAGVGGTGAAVGGGSGAFLGEGMASGVPAWDAAATKAGLTLTGGGSGLLNMAMKYGPGLLGAAIGGTSKQPGGTGREIDPRVYDYIFGGNGQRGGLSIAQDIMNQPVAPNGFSKFYGG